MRPSSFPSTTHSRRSPGGSLNFGATAVQPQRRKNRRAEMFSGEASIASDRSRVECPRV
jgi:hypothetical protein